MIQDSRCDVATHNRGKPKSYAYCKFLPIIDDANVDLCAFHEPCAKPPSSVLVSHFSSSLAMFPSFSILVFLTVSFFFTITTQKYPHCNSISLGCAHKLYFSNHACPCKTKRIGSVTSCKHNTSGSQLSITRPKYSVLAICAAWLSNQMLYERILTSSSSFAVRSGMAGSSVHFRPRVGISTVFVSIFGSSLVVVTEAFVVFCFLSNCFARSKTLSTSSL
mmetsp:Transcript_2512/g.9012  ORF Transcript_2512/g.9012 Transcript_2512/m.9012 type:complete len:220 (-) Transcript_2512:115-774(-)